MEKKHTNEEILAHFITPAFFAEDGQISLVNAAAEGLLSIGTPVESILSAGVEEYTQFQRGCLYLSLEIQGQHYSASVTRDGKQDLFVTELDSQDIALQAYGLASRQLREPMSGIMIASQRLFQNLPEDADPTTRRHAAFINQNLYKMLRILGNMSDAARYVNAADVHMENCNISSVLDELFQEIQNCCQQSGIQFTYQCPQEGIMGPIDQSKLERGIYNLISNAIKFTDKSGSVHVEVTRRGKRLYITVTDTGDGIPFAIHDTIYKRYQRTPGIEEGRMGIGLGMVLAKSVASIHGGAILMQPLERGAKITMSISLEPGDLVLRSPIFRIDYTGGRSHSLVELSDSLETDLYAAENLR